MSAPERARDRAMGRRVRSWSSRAVGAIARALARALAWRTRWIAALSVLLVVALPLVAPGCRNRRGNEIVIGVIAARSGARALWGEDLYRGIELAVEQQNGRGGVLGRRIRIAVLDSTSRDDQSMQTQLVTRLAEREGALVVFGELSSVASERAATVAARKGVPFVSPAATLRDVSRVNEWAFRTAMTDGEQASALARYARNVLQRRRAAILYRRSSLLHLAMADAFSSAFRNTGGEVPVRDTFTDEDAEMVRLAARVRSAGADVLFVPAFATDAARIAIAARHGRVGAQLLGADGWVSPELRRYDAETVLGALVTDAFAPTNRRPEIEQFIQSFRQRHHATPGTFAAHGYDAVRWVLQTAARVPSLEPRALRDALAGSRFDEAVCGAFSVDPQRMLSRQVSILRVDREAFTFVATTAP